MKRSQYEPRRECWLCGRNGSADALDKHHIFGGAFREKSERMGLTVWLCHHDCHIFGAEAVHRNSETMRRLHEYGQRLAMERNDWDIEDFRMAFGKNYLPEETESVSVIGFALLPEDAALPW